MKYIFIFFLLTSSLLLKAQEGRRSENIQAQNHYEQAGRYISAGKYPAAIIELQRAVAADNKFTAAYQQLGDLSRKVKNHKDAAAYYGKVLDLAPEFSSLTYYGLAESELNLGDYANALQHFIKYSSYPGLSDASKRLVNKHMADCRFSIEAIRKPVPFKPVNLGEGVNSVYQEYLPVITADEGRLIFTRRVNNNEDFYQSLKDTDKWGKAEYLSSKINTANFNEGAQCISPDGLYLFFTGCNRPEGLGRCDIYVCKREGKDWSEPFNIGPPVNTAGWESQPSLSADGRTLYFVSNRAGGMGGYDIWQASLLPEGKWSKPVNLGPSVNTSFDEHSPFIHPDNSTLYFSSNGWPGFGNRDLYVSRKDATGKWQQPENLGYPINTSGEESGLTVTADGQTAFFASDMKGGFGGMDIYSFVLPEKNRPQPVTYVKGKVIDAATKAPLSADVRITELKSNTVIFDEESEDENGGFLATMPEGKMFGLTVFKEGYLFHSENFSPAQGPNNKKPYRIVIPLKKIIAGETVVLKNIFFETNKDELMAESMPELNNLLNFMISNPGAVIEITGHTDDKGSDAANELLSENRARNVYNFLISKKINPSRLSFKGYGKSRPVADNSTEEGRQANRRTEVKILKN